jgi:hypothetical protein
MLLGRVLLEVVAVLDEARSVASSWLESTVAHRAGDTQEGGGFRRTAGTHKEGNIAGTHKVQGSHIHCAQVTLRGV